MGRAGRDTSVMYQRCLADPHLEIGHMQCRVTRLVWLPQLVLKRGVSRKELWSGKVRINQELRVGEQVPSL